MRKVVVRRVDGLIINAIEIEEGADWQTPKDCELLSKGNSDKTDIGDKILENKVIKPSFKDKEGQDVIFAPVALD